MARGPRELRAVAWRVDSVYVRKRDGPARVEQAYRTLLEERALEARGLMSERERGDANGDLRPGVHRAPRTGADD